VAARLAGASGVSNSTGRVEGGADMTRQTVAAPALSRPDGCLRPRFTDLAGQHAGPKQ